MLSAYYQVGCKLDCPNKCTKKNYSSLSKLLFLELTSECWTWIAHPILYYKGTPHRLFWLNYASTLFMRQHAYKIFSYGAYYHETMNIIFVYPNKEIK